MIGKIVVSLWAAFMITWIFFAGVVLSESNKMQVECDGYMAEARKLDGEEKWYQATDYYKDARDCYRGITSYINHNQPAIILFIKPSEALPIFGISFAILLGTWIVVQKVRQRKNEIR